MEELRFPIGKFELPESYPMTAIQGWINDLKKLPAEIRAAAEALSEEALDQPYRPEGWTGRQVIHHVADSHMNALIRLKLALTEDNPGVKPYHEERWAKLPDYSMPIEPSLQLIEMVHAHIVYVLERISEQDFQRMFTHPQYQYTRPLAYLCALYSWHGKHHTAHLALLKH
jgi:hypothetical protein